MTYKIKYNCKVFSISNLTFQEKVIIKMEYYYQHPENYKYLPNSRQEYVQNDNPSHDLYPLDDCPVCVIEHQKLIQFHEQQTQKWMQLIKEEQDFLEANSMRFLMTPAYQEINEAVIDLTEDLRDPKFTSPDYFPVTSQVKYFQYTEPVWNENQYINMQSTNDGQQWTSNEDFNVQISYPGSKKRKRSIENHSTNIDEPAAKKLYKPKQKSSIFRSILEMAQGSN